MKLILVDIIAQIFKKRYPLFFKTQVVFSGFLQQMVNFPFPARKKTAVLRRHGSFFTR